MENTKHYPTHPGAEHPPIMTCEIPLEEYEAIKRENAELKDKCQMHDFFWEGCGFAKRGFKNTIAVSEAFDKLEEENAELKEAQSWRKFSEEKPEKWQKVLFRAKYKTDNIRTWIGEFRNVGFDVFYASAPGWGCEFLPNEIFGWMPLPSAPKEEK